MALDQDMVHRFDLSARRAEATLRYRSDACPVVADFEDVVHRFVDELPYLGADGFPSDVRPYGGIGFLIACVSCDGFPDESDVP